jgi:hypothetical protein
MKWEHKIGIGITCTFLCLIGAVIGLKMQEQTPPESPKVAATDPGESAPPPSETKSTITFDDLGMPPPDSPPPSPRGNTSGDPPRRDPSPDNRTKANEPSQKNAMNPARGDVPTAGAATKGTPIVSAAPPLAVEPPPTARPVKGADEWGQSSSQSKEKKSKSAPATPISDLKPASSSLPLSPEAKNQQPPNQPASSVIVPAGSIEPALEPLEPQKPVAAPPSPPGTGSPPTPPAAVNSTNGAPPPEPAMPPYFSQQSTNAPKTPDPKAKEKATPLAPTPAPVKPSEMPAPYAPPALAPAVTPAIESPTPASPPPPPTAPPPSMPAAGPVIISGPTSTPAPTPPASPPPPPKPPAEGSSFIPDNPSAASGPVGVKPAPLPLPVMPPSAPLPSAPDKPASPQLVSSGPSVTVYDEQDYSCRPGDTWEGISKQFYMTDRYAKALQRHNQNHARASDRIKDNGQLAAGERIFVPQSYVLERRYADAIVPAAAPASTTTPPAPLPPSKQ